MKRRSTLPPERQELFCSYVAQVTAKGTGFYDRQIGYVFSFLQDAEEISKKGYKKYYEDHAAELALVENQKTAVRDFLYFCGVQISGQRKRAITKALEKRTELDKKAQEILNGFSAWIEKENAYSPNTVRGYIFGVKEFLKYSTTVSTEIVKSYRAALEAENKAPRTINIRLNAVECLARCLGKRIEVKHIKIPRTLSLENIPTEKEVEKLLAYAKEKVPKVYIWLRLLSTTGARVHEFRMFTYEMIAEGHVDLKGKGSKIRRFFFSKRVQEECAEYAAKNGLTGYVAKSRFGELCSTRGIAQYIRTVGEKAGIPTGKCHPHAFRHFFAKMYLKRSKTKDVTELADLLGHSGLDTTMIYIKRNQQEQQRMFNKNVDW